MVAHFENELRHNSETQQQQKIQPNLFQFRRAVFDETFFIYIYG